MADKVTIPLDIAKFKQVQHDGTIFMQCNETPEEHVPKVKAWALRDDDVILCTYPKSGTHWMYRVIDMIQRGSAEYYARNPNSTFVDAQKVEDMDTLASPRCLGTHYPFTLLPDQAKGGRTKVVHVYRNPRAVLMSAFFQMKSMQVPDKPDLSLEQFIGIFFNPNFMMYHGWFGWMDRVASYEKENPDASVMDIAYEEMSQDPDGTVAKLATFLGREVSPTLRREIVEACSFSNQKKTEEDMDGSQAKAALYRKGDKDDWKNHLTVAVNEKFTQKLKERTECRFSAKYI